MNHTFRQILTFAGHQYRRVRVFKIKMKLLFEKFIASRKVLVFNWSHLIASRGKIFYKTAVISKTVESHILTTGLGVMNA